MCWSREVMKILWGNMVLSRLQSQITVPHISATSIGKKNIVNHPEETCAFYSQRRSGTSFHRDMAAEPSGCVLKWSHFLADLNKLIDQNASILKPVCRKTSPHGSIITSET